jgi:hypothetical protein
LLPKRIERDSSRTACAWGEAGPLDLGALLGLDHLDLQRLEITERMAPTAMGR